MGDVIYLRGDRKGTAPVHDLAERIEAGHVTHGVMIWRQDDGDIKLLTIGDDHVTYLAGLCERAKLIIMLERG